MVDLDPIPFADDDPKPDDVDAVVAMPAVFPSGVSALPPTPQRWPRLGTHLSIVLILGLGIFHGLGIWRGMGGTEGLGRGWPLWRDDHPLYYHSALVTRAFLKLSGTTAGYDPAFMAGYPKSVIFPASSTLPEVVVWAFGGSRPELAYKLYVLVSAAVLPWLIALAAFSWRQRAQGAAAAVTLFLLYLWTDFPINYASFGMLPYLLLVPFGLLALGTFNTYLANGGFLRWLLAAVLLSLSALVHLTAVMIVAPAAGAAYLAAAFQKKPRSTEGNFAPARFPVSRHLGVWLIGGLVLASNAFWWLPGFWLASTKGPSDFAFAHSNESVFGRLLQIVTVAPEMEAILIGLGLPGLWLLLRQGWVRGVALTAFALAGFFWGYLAGFFASLDFLQPGRHTYAFYSAMALAGGTACDGLLLRLRGGERGARLDRWVLLAALLIGGRILAPPLIGSVRARLWSVEPFLSSRPPNRLLWIVDRVKIHVKPGERLLYEESGKDIPGVPDPFHGGRFSGLIPERTGVELLGGPYLRAALTTNFTQFGENALFGEVSWDRAHFVKYARLYRPSAILCWTPHSRRFCQANPDLIRIVEDDGTMILGRVLGFEGDAIEGTARVSAEPGRLTVREMIPGVDGLVVLRYHSVPNLRARPPVPLEPRLEEGDPVPFIGLRPSPDTREVILEMAAPFSGHD